MNFDSVNEIIEVMCPTDFFFSLRKYPLNFDAFNKKYFYKSYLHTLFELHYIKMEIYYERLHTNFHLKLFYF